jgi:hypothetical protein
VLGVLGVALAAFGAAAWAGAFEKFAAFVQFGIIGGPIFVVVGLDSLALRVLLLHMEQMNRRERTRNGILFGVLVLALSVVAVLVLCLVTLIIGISAYCVPRAWDGCGP